jgi:3-deoxy-D-manno-octulosonic-acid transferase
MADAAAYFPLDNVVAMSVAMNRMSPSAVFVAETDFWPEFSWQCRRAGIPLILVNGRISYKIADFYQRFRGLAETVFQSYSLLAVQSESDAKRLLGIGVKPEKIMVTGNMKADLTMAATTVDVSPFRRWLSGRLCVVFGSLHPCEFNTLLPAFASLAAQGFALLIAPRNPANAGGWAKQLADINITACCRSEIEKAADAPVLVLDTMGELAGLYHLGTAAFVGGSLDKTVGGHNPLEVIQQRVPLLMGPDCRNFADLCEQLRQENAILVCPDADSVTRSAEALADGTYSAGEMVDRAWNVLERNLGAMEKTMIEVRKLLKR